MREWLIKKLIGNKPVIANVTVVAVDLRASEEKVIYHQSIVKVVE